MPGTNSGIFRFINADIHWGELKTALRKHTNIFYMKFIYTTLFLFFSWAVFCQSFDKVDSYVRDLDKFSKKDLSTTVISARVVAPFTSETEKVRAIFIWVTDNIKYDIKALEVNPKDRDPNDQNPDVVLKRGKAVCEGYANLFQELCSKAGIQSLLATGNTKRPNGSIPWIGHAWNLVKADGKWHHIDATWGAGYINEKEKYVEEFDEKYFFTPSDVFIRDHLPDDPAFQMLGAPVTDKEFRLRDAAFEKMLRDKQKAPVIPAFAHVNDTLNTIVAQDTANKKAVYAGISRRLFAAEPQSPKGYYYQGLSEFEAATVFAAQFRQIWNATGKVSNKTVDLQWVNRQLGNLDNATKALQNAQKAFKQATAGGYQDNYLKYMESLTSRQMSVVDSNRSNVLELKALLEK